MVVFFADEIQSNYVNVDSDVPGESNGAISNYERRRKFIEQLATIGKAIGCIGIASGSSVNTESYALHPHVNGFPLF
jgi:hypothetical protein